MSAPRLFAARGITLLQAQRHAGTLTALFAFLACAASGELGLALGLAFPLALVAAQVVGDRAYGRAEWAWTLFLVGALFVIGAQVATGRVDIVLGAARFALLLTVHRLWHRRTERDELLLMLLSLLLLCAGAALSAEVLFGAAFVVFSVVGTWSMALTHLRFEIEGGRAQASAALLQSRRIATPALLSALAGLAMMGLFGSAIVFFTFPRVTIGGLRRPSTATPVAGLGDRIDLSAHGTIADDPRVVLRVRFDPPLPSAPASLGMHFRARALEVWTGQGWRAREPKEQLAAALGPRPRLLAPGAASGAPATRRKAGASVEAEVEAVSGFTEGVVLTPEGWPLSLEFRAALAARGPNQRAYSNRGRDLLYQPGEIGDLRYAVRVDLDAPPLELLRGRGQDYPSWIAPDRVVPDDLDPRVRALAERLAGGKDPADAAHDVEAYLSSGFSYTRELAGEQKDPVAHFLFDRKQGHCELFSSAMVLLLRTAGIPARNVTGYYGGKLTPAGYYAVRAGDAHSWVEVYIPGAGFVPFDPTPASERGSTQDGLWARLVLAWDTVQHRWSAFIVDYDLLSQAQILKRAGALFSEVGKRLAGKGAGSPDFKLALRLFVGVVLLAFAVQIARRVKLPGRAVREAKRGGNEQRAARLWAKARARLVRAGIALEPSTTAHEAARRARLPAADALVTAYLAARWGGDELHPERARALYKSLDQGLAQRAKAGDAQEEG